MSPQVIDPKMATLTTQNTGGISVSKMEEEAQHIDEKNPLSDRIDKELAQYVSDVRINISPERNAELRWKIDKRVLTVMMATYFIQGLDKGTLASASIMGLPRDTGLLRPDGTLSQNYSWLTTCVYIAVLIVEYPQTYLVSRIPIAKYLSFSVVAWGIVLASHAACTNFTGLLVVRTLLGIFEAICQPCFVLLSGMWYRREEQLARITFWYMMSGAQHIIAGLLAYCFSLIHDGPLASWKWLFLTYGILTILFGCFISYWMPDSPMRAKCFTEQEKHEMIERVRENQTGMQNRKFKREQVIEAVLDPQVWAYGIIGFCCSLPNVGLTAFANIIVKSFGFTVLQTQLLSMVTGSLLIVAMLFSTWLVRKTNQTIMVMLGFIVAPVVGTVLLMTLPSGTLSQRVGLLMSFYLTQLSWALPTLTMSLISRNVAGQSKKTAAVALNFIIWSAGTAVGPQVFLAWDAPRYYIAFATHLGCYGTIVILLLGLRWHLSHLNKRREEMAREGVEEAGDVAMLRAWEDLTDKENLTFRYVL